MVGFCFFFWLLFSPIVVNFSEPETIINKKHSHVKTILTTTFKSKERKEGGGSDPAFTVTVSVQLEVPVCRAQGEPGLEHGGAFPKIVSPLQMLVPGAEDEAGQDSSEAAACHICAR